MRLLPAIDVRDGACVQLVGGNYAAERVRLPDPVAVAEGWREMGFDALHIIDLDAATGRGDNDEVLLRLLAINGLEVQAGGGIRSTTRVEAVLAAGAARAVVGTKALEDPAWLAGIATAHPGRIVVAADVLGSEIVSLGWSHRTGRDVCEFLESIAALPLGGVLVTAVHQEGRLAGPDIDLVARVTAATRHPVQAAGGIRNLDDLQALEYAGAAYAVAGMALYAGELDPVAAARRFCR
jgi:phosphoribosylformimino-5-aminoimidazole carboxamide ribotide isomerase